MKKVSLASLLLISLISFAACGNDKGETTVAKGSATAQTNTTDSSKTIESSNSTVESSENAEGSDGIIAIGEYSADWAESWNGLDFRIDKVAIAEMTDDEIAEAGIENNFVVMVNYIITNNGDKDFNTYPNQGVLVVEGQQVDAEMWGSDDIGGEILQGVTKEGVALYSVKNIEDVAAVKNIRLKWSADYDTDNWEEEYMKEFDVTFDLTAEK